MKARMLSVLLIALAVATPVAGKDLVRGSMMLLESCPGDDETAVKTNESFIATVLTPLLTGVVGQGLKAAGAKLTEAAQEANVDVLHRGEHLYAWSTDKYVLGHRCVIVASKGTANSKRTPIELADGYQKATYAVAGGKVNTTWQDGKAKLGKHLTDNEFSQGNLPGILGVFDIKLSTQKTEARLVPRFVVLDHGVRGGRTDTKPRTITFEFDFTVPGSDKSFGKPIVKLDKLVIGQPFTQDMEDPRVASTWYALPQVSEAVDKALKAHREAKALSNGKLEEAKLAGKAAELLGDTDIGGYLTGPPPPCPTEALARRRWATHHALLQVEAAKKANKQPHKVPQFENSTLYYQSCVLYHKHQKVVQGSALSDKARSFDLTVTLKEFRKRPFAKFFGQVLSDDTTRAGLTSAIVGEIDPATKAAQAKKDAEELNKAREAFETALVAAETAIVAYEAATTNTDKAAKLVDMESKKRAANRAAQVLGLAMPYPGSGLWGSVGG